MVAAAVFATRVSGAIAHRTGSFERDARGHLFLLRAGRAVLTRPPAPACEITAPALLWLPASTRATLEVLAGGDGFTASIAADFVQRTLASAALTAPLRPLLEQTLIAGPDMIAPRLPGLAMSFDALVEEAQHQLPGAAAMIAMHLGLLLVQLWRATHPGDAVRLRGAGTTTAQRFRQLVELHYRDGMRIDDFAARLGVSRAHLHDACRRASGRTPLALLHERLLQEARSRLEQTDLSIEQVGYGIGFRDPAYFSRFFKRLSGAAPGTWRRRAAAARPAPASALSYASWP